MKTALAITLCTLALGAPAVAHAEASEFQPRALGAANDYESGKKAVERKDWKAAAGSFEAAARSDPNDADAQNMLAYSHRKLGNMDLAFRYYAKALELNPKHLGAHEYVGEAYLMAGKPAKAKEHLVLLEKFCPQGCEERDDLRKAIAEYERKAGR
jgi:Tfp pilus assembly protein PilF